MTHGTGMVGALDLAGAIKRDEHWTGTLRWTDAANKTRAAAMFGVDRKEKAMITRPDIYQQVYGSLTDFADEQAEHHQAPAPSCGAGA